jgi:hypothetical protein
MARALAQVAEPAGDYDAATIALFVLFILSVVITAGLLVRELLTPPPGGRDEDSIREPAPPDRAGAPSPPAYPEWHRTAPLPPRSGTLAPPAWFSQAVSSQRATAAAGLRQTVDRLIEASNRGNLRAGFACYTPEHLARHQQELGIDASELERLARLEPVPAAQAIVVTAVRDIRIDPPYRATAIVEYTFPDGSGRAPEEFHFLYDRASETWLIDAIDVLPEPPDRPG